MPPWVVTDYRVDSHVDFPSLLSGGRLTPSTRPARGLHLPRRGNAWRTGPGIHDIEDTFAFGDWTRVRVGVHLSSETRQGPGRYEDITQHFGNEVFYAAMHEGSAVVYIYIYVLKSELQDFDWEPNLQGLFCLLEKNLVSPPTLVSDLIGTIAKKGVEKGVEKYFGTKCAVDMQLAVLASSVSGSMGSTEVAPTKSTEVAPKSPMRMILKRKASTPPSSRVSKGNLSRAVQFHRDALHQLGISDAAIGEYMKAADEKEQKKILVSLCHGKAEPSKILEHLRQYAETLEKRVGL